VTDVRVVGECYGCGVDYLTLPLGAPCPCTPPSGGGACIRCGGPLSPARTGRPPKMCPDCSPHRRRWARMTPAERRAQIAAQRSSLRA